MSLERELKFSMTDAPPSFDELQDALALSPFRLVEAGTRRLRDHYYDDDERSLRRAGYALRRRSGGDVEVATLKGRAVVRGALHERDEIEATVEDGAWPERVLAHLRGLLRDGPQSLAPRVELEVERIAYRVLDASGPVALLTFDDVAARAIGSERDALFREAELEAFADTSAATLEAVAERLERVLVLTPSGVNKLDRAEAVLSLGAVL